VTSLLAGWPGIKFDSWQEQKIFLFPGSYSASYPNRYQGVFLWGWNGWGVKLSAMLHLILRLRMMELYLHSSIYHIFVEWCVIEHKDNFIFTFAFTFTSQKYKLLRVCKPKNDCTVLLCSCLFSNTYQIQKLSAFDLLHWHPDCWNTGVCLMLTKAKFHRCYYRWVYFPV
jgi:hypothetical protein